MSKKSKGKFSLSMNKLFGVKNMFFIFGMSFFIFMMLSFMYYIGERLNIAPVMYVNEVGDFNQGESLILYVIVQTIGIFSGMILIFIMFRYIKLKVKNKKK